MATSTVKEESWPGGQWSVKHDTDDCGGKAEEITVGSIHGGSDNNSTWGRQTIIQIEDFETFCANDDAVSAFSFRRDNSLARRRHLYQRIQATFAERVPVIVALHAPASKLNRSDVSTKLQLAKERFVCPNDMTAGAFLADIRRYVYCSNKNRHEYDPETAGMFLLTERGSMVTCTKTMGDVWEREKHQQDHFLYVFLQQEAVFGSDNNSQSLLLVF